MANQNQKSSEFTEKVVYVNRCSKVVKGGRKFSFSALILVSDDNGKVGFGFAKANELTDAIKKGGDLAKKEMRTFTKDGTTIPHEVLVKWDGVVILLKPLPPGTGVIAGSKVRSVLELAGYSDVMAKIIGSNNAINQVRATFKALDSLTPKKEIEKKRSTVTC